MGNTSIQWTDKTWSPIRAKVKENAAEIATAKGYTSLVKIAGRMAGHIGPHCERVSHGCDHCYSDTNNGRCLPANGTGLPFDRRSRDLIDTFVDEHILRQPLSWKKPQRIFLENQSDLFGEWVSDEDIDRVFAVMVGARRHTFQVLTKRPLRMLQYLSANRWELVSDQMHRLNGGRFAGSLPTENIWLGVSVEDQKTADERIPILIQAPASIRFVSYEPALGPVDFSQWLRPAGFENQWLDQIIIGGESGPGARPFYVDWARTAISQCLAAGVAPFMKQVGRYPNGSGFPPEFDHRKRDRKGGLMNEWPPEIRVRQFPQTKEAL